MNRPTAVTVFGVLNLVFGGFGLLCVPLQTLSTLAMMPGLQQMNENMGMEYPMLDVLDSPMYRMVMIAYLVMTLAGAIALVAGGIGLLKLRPWGRTLSILYGGFKVVAVPIVAVVNYVAITRPMLEQMPTQAMPFASFTSATSTISAVLGCCFQMAYPIILLIFMFTRSVRGAFQQSQIAPLPPEYQPPPPR